MLKNNQHSFDHFISLLISNIKSKELYSIFIDMFWWSKNKHLDGDNIKCSILKIGHYLFLFKELSNLRNVKFYIITELILIVMINIVLSA